MGVAPGVISAERLAVIRGQVLDPEGAPLPSVLVTVLDHPELGATRTREDGWFDLAVNGGGLVVLTYYKDGYLPAQRAVPTRWEGFAAAPDVRLVPWDPIATSIEFTEEMAVARGNEQVDADGARQATLFFPGGTTATMTLPDGSAVPLPQLTVRATEYTVGPGGPQAMPGPLPPTSGYTYAVELSADEALDAGATRIDFSRPIPFYIENFIDIPVGQLIPVGTYDPTRGVWMPEKNGRVVEVLDTAMGVASLDVDGSGEPASAEVLAELGFTDAELMRVAELYLPGQRLWRVALSHFSTVDCNLSAGPTEGASPPPPCLGGTCEPPVIDDPCHGEGSIIECQNQVLGERIDLPGIPFSLIHRSNRTPGWKAGRTLNLPLLGEEVPPGLKRVDVEIVFADHVDRASYPPQVGVSHRWQWDGTAYGRPWVGEAIARVSVGYVYQAVYYPPVDLESSFASYPSSTTLSSDRARGEATLTTTWEAPLTNPAPDLWPVAGWSLGVHHVYLPDTGTLLRGDGGQRQALAVSRTIATVAGSGVNGEPEDGADAATAPFRHVLDLEIDDEGILYFVDSSYQVRRINTDGTIETVAGVAGTSGFSGDGGPATEAQLSFPGGIAVDRDGNVFIADTQNNRVRRVGADGIITTVAGGGEGENRWEGSLATNTSLYRPADVEVDGYGNLYIADSYNLRVRRVGVDGVITTVAGNGLRGSTGDGGLGREAAINGVGDIVIDGEGSVYISELYKVRKVTADGIITTFAGTGAHFYGGDGVPATQTPLNDNGKLALDSDGNLYIADTNNYRIRRVDRDGIITTVAGNGIEGFSEDGAPATGANIGEVLGIAVDPADRLLIADTWNFRLRQVATRPSMDVAAEHLITSDDGAELYLFDATGRHLETRDATTGVTLLTFTYADGHLAAITDVHGKSTTIERGDNGLPQALVGPYGHRAALEIDGDGHLIALHGADGAAWRMGYGEGGLLTSFTEPKGIGDDPADDLSSTFTYDPDGRLLSDTAADGTRQSLSRLEGDAGFSITLGSPTGRTTVYSVEALPAGGQRRGVMTPDGIMATVDVVDGAPAQRPPDGSVILSTEGADPRWGMSAPVTTWRQTKLPSRLTEVVEESRTATLADATDPLSHVQLKETSTVYELRTTTHVFDRPVGADDDPTTPRGGTWTTASPAARTSTTQVDVYSQPTRTQHADLYPWEMTYDEHGRLATLAHVRLDDQGRPVAGGARTTSLAYHPCADGASTCATDAPGGGMKGYLASITDADGRQSAFTYDAAGRVLAAQLPAGRDVTFTYDPNGNLLSLTPPGRPAHGFTYTAVDLVDSYIPPIIGDDPTMDEDVEVQTLYTYDPDRLLIQVAYPDGDVIDYTHGFGERLTAATTSTGITVAWDYGGDATGESKTGQLATITRSEEGRETQSLSYSWDGFLPLAEQWVGLVDGKVSQTWDTNLWMKTQTVTGSPTISYTYDSDGLLTRASALQLARDPLNGLVEGATLTAPNGASAVTTYTWSGFGELASMSTSRAGDQLLTLAYERDVLGRITQRTETTQGGTPVVWSYAYDDAGRLASVLKDGALEEAYEYDLNGNRTAVETSHSLGVELMADHVGHDAQDRQLRYGDVLFDYTANGELVTRAGPDGTTRYDYDPFGNLLRVDQPDGTVIEYLVDGRNRRIGRKVDGVRVEGYLYGNQLNVVALLDGQGDVVYRFVYGMLPHVPDYAVSADGAKVYRIVTDHLGSLRMVVDVAGGAVKQRMTYDAYGRVLTDEAAQGFVRLPFGFAGGLYDRETGLVRFGARDYDAEVGRWTAPDPSGLIVSAFNNFAYAYSDPVNHIDESGEVGFVIAVVGMAASVYGIFQWIEKEAQPAIQGPYERWHREDCRPPEIQAPGVSRVPRCDGPDPNRSVPKAAMRASRDLALKVLAAYPSEATPAIDPALEFLMDQVQGTGGVKPCAD